MNEVTNMFQNIVYDNNIALIKENKNYTYGNFLSEVCKIQRFLIENKLLDSVAVMVDEKLSFSDIVLICATSSLNSNVFIINSNTSKEEIEKLSNDYSIKFLLKDNDIQYSVPSINVNNIPNYDTHRRFYGAGFANEINIYNNNNMENIDFETNMTDDIFDTSKRVYVNPTLSKESIKYLVYFLTKGVRIDIRDFKPEKAVQKILKHKESIALIDNQEAEYIIKNRINISFMETIITDMLSEEMTDYLEDYINRNKFQTILVKSSNNSKKY